MDTFTLILCVLAAVVLSSFLSRFLPKISTPLVQIALGVLATYLPFFPDTELDPELFMVLFIAPLLYLEAHEIDKSALFKSLKISLSLAIGLAIATMVAVGFTVHTFWPAIPLAAAFALGAALGPTDAVAVSSLGKEAALTQRQLSVLKGESLFNDASGIVGFQFSILAAVTGVFSFGEAAGEFVVSFIGGTLFGLAVGLVVNWLFLPFLLYLAAEDIAHVSGILAVVACGLLVRFDHTGIGPNVARTNIVSSSVWAVLSFSLNGAVFILLGMLLPDAMSRSWEDPGVSNPMLISVILLVALVVIVMRFLWVAAMLRITKDQHTGKRRRMTAERWRSAAVMTFGGPKGTITLSLMLTIPFFTSSGDLFPMRDELIFIASGVIIVTLLLANFLLPLIAPNHGADDSHEITEITIDVLRRTVEELTQRITPENRRAVLMVIDSYTKRITRLKQRIGGVDPHGFEQLQIDALYWEKDFIKERLATLRAQPSPDDHERDLAIEACERMLDQIMDTLRHAADHDFSGHAVSQIRGRVRALQRRTEALTRRVISKIQRTTPLLSEDEVTERVRTLQVEAIEHVINRLYDEIRGTRYSTEHCSLLLLDYRRAEATLRARPSVGAGAAAFTMADDVKRESYGIEMGIIQDMFETGDITRAQARALRRNVYVMSVDADASL